jgi:ADP-ribose pyrophosphatase
MAGKPAKNERVKVLNSEEVFKGRVFGVRRDRIREPGGIVATREIITHHGSIVVLPVFPDGSILLIRQYRYAAQSFLWELVAGHLEPGESKLRGAHRELIEETGYTSKKMRLLLEIFPSPGFVTEKMWIFLATGLTEGVARPEDDEKITSKRISLAAAEKMIRGGSIRDAKSVAGILFYSRFAKK